MRSLLDLSSLRQEAWSFDPQGSVYSNRFAKRLLLDLGRERDVQKDPQATRRNSQTRTALTDKELSFHPLNKEKILFY